MHTVRVHIAGVGYVNVMRMHHIVNIQTAFMTCGLSAHKADVILSMSIVMDTLTSNFKLHMCWKANACVGITPVCTYYEVALYTP